MEVMLVVGGSLCRLGRVDGGRPSSWRVVELMVGGRVDAGWSSSLQVVELMVGGRVRGGWSS
jgi:hypothetical protein